jgi:hypothetical protein
VSSTKHRAAEDKARVCALALLGLALVLSGCGVRATSLPAVFPDADTMPGWTAGGKVEVFDRETIFHLVDGQADVFFAYGLRQVAVGRYENAKGIALDVHIWQLATPQDAYGLFTLDAGGAPADVGNESDLEPGRRLAFWQNRYTIWVHARPGLDDAELLRFARVFSEALPRGGERPALMDRLPNEGLVERSAVFFHEEISIQDRLWLGGENLLGLSARTDGILARYETGGGTAQLLLIQYPGARAAVHGLTALAGSPVEGVITADVHGNMLGAVFGEAHAADASSLLARALAAE